MKLLSKFFLRFIPVVITACFLIIITAGCAGRKGYSKNGCINDPSNPDSALRKQARRSIK